MLLPRLCIRWVAAKSAGQELSRSAGQLSSAGKGKDVAIYCASHSCVSRRVCVCVSVCVSLRWSILPWASVSWDWSEANAPLISGLSTRWKGKIVASSCQMPACVCRCVCVCVEFVGSLKINGIHGYSLAPDQPKTYATMWVSARQLPLWCHKIFFIRFKVAQWACHAYVCVCVCMEINKKKRRQAALDLAGLKLAGHMA